MYYTDEIERCNLHGFETRSVTEERAVGIELGREHLTLAGGGGSADAAVDAYRARASFWWWWCCGCCWVPARLKLVVRLSVGRWDTVEYQRYH